MSGLDLDAIDAAGAAMTCCRSRCYICGRKSWCGGHAMGDSACTRPGAVECRAVATVRRLRSDLADKDTTLTLATNAADRRGERIARLEADLAAARAEADALRRLVGEACDGWEDQAAMSTDGPASIRARAGKAGWR